MLAKDLRKGDRLRVDEGNAYLYPIKSVGVPFIADGTIRVKVEGFYWLLAIPMDSEVEAERGTV